MRIPVPFVLASAFAIALALAPTAGAAPDVTPLESTPGLSSGFGEFRDAHFHAGLDYSTDDQEGRPVRAVNDGWVERVRASGVGYGRAVYLRLDDGRTVVYGHLSRFAPKLDAFVGAHQESTGVYEQDLVPMPGLIRFARGEIVAWSGQSGAGPPHLHFEVRRGDENYNPLLHGFAMPDHVAPTLAAAWLTPHGPHARVGGGIDEVRVALRAGATVTAPSVVGDFDLAVDTWDRADGKPNKLATYRLEARVDGAKTPAFEAVVDSFSWDTTVEVERVYDYAATLRGDETRRTLAKLPSYKEAVVRRGPAVWSLPLGTHRIELTAVDEAGNRAVATLVLPVVASGAAATASGARHPARATIAGKVETLRGRTFYAVRNPSASAAPQVDGAILADSLLSNGRWIDAYVVRPPDRSWSVVPDSGRARLVPLYHYAPFGGSWLVVLAPVDDTVHVDDSGGQSRADRTIELRFDLPPNALFDSTAIWFRRVPQPMGVGELVPFGDAVDVIPHELTLRNAVRVTAAWWTVPTPPGIPSRAGLFVQQTTGWSLVATRDPDGVFHGSTRRLGTFAVFADTTAPTIVAAPETRWRHAPAAPGATAATAAADSSRAPRLSFIIRDRGAGLAPADQSIFVDGRRVPAEYDPEASRLNWYPRAWPAAGRHEVRIEAVDRLGNRAVRVVSLAVD